MSRAEAFLQDCIDKLDDKLRNRPREDPDERRVVILGSLVHDIAMCSTMAGYAASVDKALRAAVERLDPDKDVLMWYVGPAIHEGVFDWRYRKHGTTRLMHGRGKELPPYMNFVTAQASRRAVLCSGRLHCPALTARPATRPACTPAQRQRLMHDVAVAVVEKAAPHALLLDAYTPTRQREDWHPHEDSRHYNEAGHAWLNHRILSAALAALTP